MRVQGKHFTHEWERPVKAVLDYFELNDVTMKLTLDTFMDWIMQKKWNHR